EDGIRDRTVTGVQTCALPISLLCCAVGPSSHLARNFFRALLACHQVSATIATPQCKPSRSELPSTEKASRTPGRALISSKLALKIGRASCRERGWSWVAAAAL